MQGQAFSDFLQQLPSALILNMCIPAVLLLGALFYFYYLRPRRKNASSERQDNRPPVSDFHDDQIREPLPARIDTGDLPDLDLLLSPEPIHQPPARQPDPPQRHAAGTYAVKLHTGQQTTAVEILTILRDTSDDRLIIQMGDTAYRTLSDSPDVKKEFTKIMRQLSEVVTQADDDRPASPSADSAPDVQTTDVPELIEDSTPSLSDLLQPDTPAISIPPPPTTRDGSMPGDLPSFKLDDNPLPKPEKRGLFRRSKVDSPPIPEVNIGEAIEAYLQHKLRYTQAYNDRRIHVHPTPDGGVSIEVDGAFYDAVGDVTDAEVRAFLAATIQEWQERQSNS